MSHSHEKKEKGKEKQVKWQWIFYLFSIVFFILGFFPILEKYRIIVYGISVLLAGYDLLWEGIKNIFHFNFEEDTLMTIAVIAAFIIGEYPESCLVVLLFKLGEFIEDKAVERSHSNIEDIVKIKANFANRVKENDDIEVVKVEEIKIGDKILIKPGEKVPVDCLVLKGKSELDTSAITGESNPQEVKEKQELLSGSINLTGALICEVVKDFSHSTASQIIDLVYEATNNKGKTEKFITKFSKIYTPIVIILAIFIVAIPAIIRLDMHTWIMRALFFLVASCPCSLVISVPLSFFSCIGAISKKGMVIKGTKHIEDLAKANVVALDKTGTLTTGKMTIDKIGIVGEKNKQEVLQYIYSMEKLSNHPISTAVTEKITGIESFEVEDYQEIPGHGLVGKIQKEKVVLGNEKLLKKYGIQWEEKVEGAIYLAINNKLQGYMTLKEEIREDVSHLVKDLKALHINDVMMLTGDNKSQAIKIAKQLSISSVLADLLPQEKLEAIKKEKKQKKKVIFVGDGINDGPVLATANFGISMGEGTEIANDTADGILLSNRVGMLPTFIKIARKSMSIIRTNIIFSLAIKFIVLVIGFLGYAPIWAAILADTGVTLLTILNSLRIFRGC